jgi:hypothetical protein
LLTGGDKIRFTVRFDDAIYGLEKDRVVEKYRIDLGAKSLPDRYRDPAISREELDEAPSDAVFGIADVQESGHFLLFTTNTAGLFVHPKSEPGKLVCYPSIHVSELDITLSIRPVSVESVSPSYAQTIDPLSFARNGQRRAEMQAAGRSVPPLSPLMRELTERVKEDDNPILLLWQLR